MFNNNKISNNLYEIAHNKQIPFRLNNLDELHGMGLYLNDLNPHGLSKEMVMAGWQHCSRSL